MEVRTGSYVPTAHSALPKRGMARQGNMILPQSMKSQDQVQISFGAQNDFLKSLQAGKPILPSLLHADVSGAAFEKALYRITKSPEMAQQFIAEVTADPRESQKIGRIFVDKLGRTEAGKENPVDGVLRLHEWLQAPDGYNMAFREYASDLVDTAKSPEELLGKLGPDVGIWTLRSKGREMGQVPTEFIDSVHFEKFMDALRASEGVRTFARLDEETKDLNAFLTKNFTIKGKVYIPKNHPNLRYEISPKVSQEIIAKHYANELAEEALTQTIVVEGRAYRTKAILGGISGKMVFKVETPENETFIVKANPGLPNEALNLENMHLRSDSAHWNAAIAFFLKEHQAKGVPMPKYYSYDKAAVVFPYIQGKQIMDDGDHIFDLKQVRKYVDDMERLGVHPHDVAAKNFLKETHTGDMYFPDLGNISYSDLWRPISAPGVKAGQLPNMCGMDVHTQNGDLFRLLAES